MCARFRIGKLDEMGENIIFYQERIMGLIFSTKGLNILASSEDSSHPNILKSGKCGQH